MKKALALLLLFTCLFPRVYAETHSSPGKPQAPVDISSEAGTPFAPGEKRKTKFTIIPLRDCEELTVRIRGLRGTKSEGPPRESTRDCRSTAKWVIERDITVPKNKFGRVAVDVEMKFTNGKQLASRSIRIKVVGQQDVGPKAEGTALKDDDGTEIIELNAEEVRPK